MKKTILSLALLSALTSAAFAEDIVVSEGETYENDIVAEDASITLENNGSINNDQIILKGGFLKNTGTLITGLLDIESSSSLTLKGEITAKEGFIFRSNGFGYTKDLNAVLHTKLLHIVGDDASHGLAITNQEVIDDVDAIRIESHGVKVGLMIDAGAESVVEIMAPITLINDTKEDARVEIDDGNSVRLHDVTVINRKGLIQLNDESNVTVDHISVERGAYLNLQVNKIDGSVEDTGIFTIDKIDLAEDAKIRGSVYGSEASAGWEKTNSNLVVTGKDVTINLAQGAGVDFGGYNEKDDHSWRPEDIEFSAQSVTINIADSSSGNYVYFSGVEGKLKTDPYNIHVVADASNNTGSAVADLEKLANVVKTNVKVGEEKQNELSCLPGVFVEQQASDIYDGATATVANGCPNCTITNVRIQDNPNVHGIAEMAALGLHIWRNEIDDMHRRVGELRDSSAQSNGLWTRVYHGKAEYGDQNVTNRYTAFQFGYDRQVQDGFWLGGAFSYTDGDNNFDYGNGDSNLYTFSGYGSWLFGNGVYLDLVGKIGRMKNAFDIRFNDIKSTGDYHTNAASLSAEMGWRYFATEELYLEPQVQMWYGHVFDADYHTSTGIKVENDSVDSLVGRVGVKMGYKDSQGRGGVFLKASVLHDWEGDAKFRYSKGANVSRTLTESLGGTWYEYGLGADYNATDQVHLYADLEAGNGGEVDTDYRFNVGVRYAW